MIQRIFRGIVAKLRRRPFGGETDFTEAAESILRCEFGRGFSSYGVTVVNPVRPSSVSVRSPGERPECSGNAALDRGGAPPHRRVRCGGVRVARPSSWYRFGRVRSG